jgi:2-phospho-L-lactate guanylyltransferase
MIRALVPAKTLVEAKGRLASALSENERRDLVLAMLEDVLTALARVPAIDSVSVVSPDNDVLHLAAQLGANPIAESAGVRGMNQALTRALSAMSPQLDTLVVVLADLPEISPADVGTAIDTLPERGVLVCPSDDGGTSLLAVRPPNVIPFSFGPRSAAAHRQAAEGAGVEYRELTLDSLRRDVDSPQDLLRLLDHSQGGATQRLLAPLELGERLRQSSVG